jgi:hypothetical protein
MRRSVLVLPLAVAATVLSAPLRSPWAGFPRGSFVKTKTTTVVTVGSHKLQTTTDITQTVLEVKGDVAVIETTATMNGVPRPTRSRSEVSLKEAPPAAGTLRKSGTESLQVAGRTIRCEWTEYETDMAGNSTTVRTWTAAEVPGGVARSVSRNALMESTLEVLAFEIK